MHSASLGELDKLDTNTSLVPALELLATSTRYRVEPPSFDGDRTKVEEWAGHVRIYLEASGEQGRPAVLQLASKFSGKAILWFGDLKSSLTSPEELIEGIFFRFKGRKEVVDPVCKFYRTLTRGREPSQSWEDFILELRHLANTADIDEDAALIDVRKQCRFMSRKTSVAAVSWTVLLDLVRIQDAKLAPRCSHCKVEVHSTAMPKKETK